MPVAHAYERPHRAGPEFQHLLEEAGLGGVHHGEQEAHGGAQHGEQEEGEAVRPPRRPLLLGAPELGLAPRLANVRVPHQGHIALCAAALLQADLLLFPACPGRFASGGQGKEGAGDCRGPRVCGGGGRVSP